MIEQVATRVISRPPPSTTRPSLRVETILRDSARLRCFIRVRAPTACRAACLCDSPLCRYERPGLRRTDGLLLASQRSTLRRTMPKEAVSPLTSTRDLCHSDLDFSPAGVTRVTVLAVIVAHACPRLHGRCAQEKSPRNNAGFLGGRKNVTSSGPADARPSGAASS